MSELAMNPANFPATPRTGNRWWTAIARFFTASAVATVEDPAPPKARRHADIPRRAAYLESAAMSREMYRL
jgi:hypothetical protein